MATAFDSKFFNPEVFKQYMDRVPNTRLNMLVNSRAITARPDLASSMRDQVGGNYISTPMKGLIGGDPLNYDGNTNITAGSTKSYMHSRVVVGRAKAWQELDFSYDITGGVDFMENVAQQLSDYWQTVDQDTIVAILKGIFNMQGVANEKFVNAHTANITAVTNANSQTGYMDATSLNSAIQKASGDHKTAFSLIIMHSAVATNLENQNLLTYIKQNDANGMQRDTGLATLNGKLVMIDDSMPVSKTETTAGTYTATFDSVAANDIYGLCGVRIKLDATSGASASAAATAMKTALEANEEVAAVYTVTRNNGVLTLTEKSGHYGSGTPTSYAGASNAGTLTVAAGTAAVVSTTYTSYVLGAGALEYTDCGVMVPYEMDRDPAAYGGKNILYTRQRKCWAPYGVSFTKEVMSSASPTLSELQDGANWELVSTPAGSGREYIDHKAIPIVRIISLG